MAEDKNKDLYGKKTNAVPKPEKNIGVDVKDDFAKAIIDAASANILDFSEIEKFTTISQRRDELFSLLDAMSNDSKVMAVLETFAEDATEANDQGQIVWAEAGDANISKYINFLLTDLNVDKKVFAWCYSLCKYGDVYVRLYKQSEIEDDLLADRNGAKAEIEKQNEIANDLMRVDANEVQDRTMNEKLIYRAFDKNDKYAHYVEAIPNPAEVFELTKFGKSYAYIQAPVQVNTSYAYQDEWNNLDLYNFQRYKFRKSDIQVFPATTFVHACLKEGNNRYPEHVDIYRTQADWDADTTDLSYTVNRGQSLLYPAFKVWRELQLLENSVLLNRVTKSSLVRVVGIQVQDMPKENVKILMNHMKQLIEQKTALNIGNSMSEYTNPGPIENNIFVPIYGEQGTISTTDIGGGDPNVKDLADLDYYMNLFYGTMKVPKQYFSQTDDATGFNGGTSLTIVSSRYAKTVKRVQQAIIQMVTDMINLMLVDKGLVSYIGKFAIKMQKPTTQEDITRRESSAANISLVSDIMNIIGDIEDPIVRLRIIKQLFANNQISPEVLSILQEEINRMEKEKEEEKAAGVEGTGENEAQIDVNVNSGGGGMESFEDFGSEPSSEPSFEESTFEAYPAPAAEETGAEEISLPSMGDLGLDFADNSQFNG